MRELQLLWNETEKRLQSLGIIMSGTEPLTDPDSNKASNVAKKIFSDIAIEIEKAIDFYISQNDETSAPELIIFGGSGVCIGNIDKYISNKLKIKTVLCESLNNVYYPREFIENRETPLNIQALTTIMGLALKGFTN
jgi:Tfp pilus assembly PilM family ATPase